MVTLPTATIALAAYCFTSGWNGFLFSISGLGFGFAVFFIPYLMGGMGAGDVKLMSAAGAVLGFKQIVVASFFVAMCGGLMALGFVVYRRSFKSTFSKIFMSGLYLVVHNDSSLLKVDNDIVSKDRMPYAVAITSGVILFLLYLFLTEKTLPVV